MKGLAVYISKQIQSVEQECIPFPGLDGHSSLARTLRQFRLLRWAWYAFCWHTLGKDSFTSPFHIVQVCKHGGCTKSSIVSVSDLVHVCFVFLGRSVVQDLEELSMFWWYPRQGRHLSFHAFHDLVLSTRT